MNMKKTRNTKDNSLKQSTSMKRSYNKSIETLSDDELRPDNQYLFKTMKSLNSNKDIQSIEQIYIIINDLKQQNSILIDKCSSLEDELKNKQKYEGGSNDSLHIKQIAKALSLDYNNFKKEDILNEICKLKQENYKNKQYANVRLIYFYLIYKWFISLLVK